MSASQRTEGPPRARQRESSPEIEQSPSPRKRVAAELSEEDSPPRSRGSTTTQSTARRQPKRTTPAPPEPRVRSTLDSGSAQRAAASRPTSSGRQQAAGQQPIRPRIAPAANSAPEANHQPTAAAGAESPASSGTPASNLPNTVATTATPTAFDAPTARVAGKNPAGAKRDGTSYASAAAGPSTAANQQQAFEEAVVRHECSLCPSTSGASRQFPNKEKLVNHWMSQHGHGDIPAVPSDQIGKAQTVQCKFCCGIFCNTSHWSQCPLAGAAKDALQSNFATTLKSFHDGSFVFADASITGLPWDELLANVPTFEDLPANTAVHRAFLQSAILALSAVAANRRKEDKTERDAAMKVFIFLPKLICARPVPSNNPQHKPKLLMRKRLLLLQQQKYGELIAEMKGIAKDWSNLAYEPRSMADKAAAAAAKLRNGEPGRAMAILHSSSSVANPADPAVLNKIKQKFPEHAEHHVKLDVGDADGDPITEEALSRVISQLHTDAAPGVSGWRNSYFAALKKAGLLSGLTVFINMILKQEVPRALLDLLRAGSLTPLCKPNGDIRPIGILDALVRLIGEVSTTFEIPQLSECLKPFQFGVCVRGGSEAIIHAVRAKLELFPDHVTLAADESNAFNSISRSALDAAVRKLPIAQSKLLRMYVNFVYGNVNRILVRGGLSLDCKAGVMQGDPVAPFLFSLCMDPVLRKLPPSVSTMAYLDDVTLTGAPADVAQALLVLSEESAKAGLSVNCSKSLVFLHSASVDRVALAQLPAEIPRIEPSEGFTLLGAPVGSPEFMQKFVQSLVQRIASCLDDVKHMRNVQDQYILTKQCVVSSLNFASRTIPPSIMHPGAVEIDAMIATTFADWVNVPLTNSTISSRLERIRLPTAFGGSGLHSIVDGLADAYVASLATAISAASSLGLKGISECFTKIYSGPDHPSALRVEALTALTRIREVVEAFSSTDFKELPQALGMATLNLTDVPTKLDHLFSPVFKVQKKRKLMSTRLSVNKLLEVPQAADDKKKAELQQFKSTLLPGSAAWLSTLPTSHRFRLANKFFTMALRLQFNLPVIELFGLRGGEVCKCGRVLSDDHLLKCPYAYSFADRHNSVRDIVNECLRDAGFTTDTEVALTLSDKRRMDIVVQKYGPDQHTQHLDITVVSPLVDSNFSSDCLAKFFTAGQAASDDKLKKYGDLFPPNNKSVTFKPLAFESYGGMSAEVVDLIDLCASKKSNVAPDDCSWASNTFKCYWIQSFSATLHRMNSRNVLKLLGSILGSRRRNLGLCPLDEGTLRV